jgi:hypothetical protein
VYSQTRPCGEDFDCCARRVVRGVPVHVVSGSDRGVAEQVATALICTPPSSQNTEALCRKRVDAGNAHASLITSQPRRNEPVGSPSSATRSKMSATADGRERSGE